MPGPQQALYFNGARLKALYPLSIVTHGQGLNITSLGYGNYLHLGLTACHRIMPDVAQLAVRVRGAFEELLQRCGISP